MPAGSQVTIDTDFDGDGRMDSFSIVRSADGAVVQVMMAGAQAPWTLRLADAGFACSPVAFAAGCGPSRPTARAVEVDAAFRRAFMQMFEIGPEHMPAFANAHAVVVPLQDADPFWFYWDPSVPGMTWARL